MFYLSHVKTILISLFRDFRNEWRSLYQLGGLLSFLIGVCYLIYFFRDKNQNIGGWNLNYWLVYLFLSFFIGSRIFEDDLGRFRLFIHQIIHPLHLFISKIIFVFVLLTTINLLILFFFRLFNPEINVDLLHWLFLCLLFNLGMSTLICFSSLLNSNIKNSTLLLTIIILPLSFPLLGVVYSTSLSLLEGMSLFDLGSKIRLIIAIDFITISFGILLYSHLIRN